MTVKFKRFYRLMAGEEVLLEEAAQFASQIPPDRIINISSGANGVVVWYWDSE